MYSIDYLIEKFGQAVTILATGEGDARSRMGEAYYKFWHILPKEYPTDLQEDVLWITRMLTRLEGREGYILPDNLRRMKNKTASKIAHRILYIYLELVKRESRKQNS